MIKDRELGELEKAERALVRAQRTQLMMEKQAIKPLLKEFKAMRVLRNRKLASQQVLRNRICRAIRRVVKLVE